jgi:hypothetical protein
MALATYIAPREKRRILDAFVEAVMLRDDTVLGARFDHHGLLVVDTTSDSAFAEEQFDSSLTSVVVRAHSPRIAPADVCLT